MASVCYSANESGKVFVLQNIPADYNEDLIIDYVESTLDIDVKGVQLHPLVPGRALVFLKKQLGDFPEANRKIQKVCMESKNVTLLTTSRGPAVVVSDLDTNKLSEQFLCLYLECEFAAGSEVIKSSETWPELNMAIVHFYPAESAVVENILECSNLVPLPSENYHITIQPFYHSFHEYIEQPGKQNEGIETTTGERGYSAFDNNDKKVKKEEAARKDSDEEDDSKMQEEESEEESTEDEEESEEEEENVEVKRAGKEMKERKSKKSISPDDTDESEQSEEEEEDVEVKGTSKEMKERKNKKSVSTDETDQSEQSDMEVENTDAESIINQGSAKERGKDKSSAKKESLMATRGSRGRGMGRGRGGPIMAPSSREAYAKGNGDNKVNNNTTGSSSSSFMAPSRRGAYAKGSGDNKVNNNTTSKNRSSSLTDRQHSQNEDGELESRYEIQGRDDKRSGKSELQPNSESPTTCHPSSDEGRMSEHNSVKSSGRTYRGRGGTAFVPTRTAGAPSMNLTSDRNVMSENESHGGFSFSKLQLDHRFPEQINNRQSLLEKNTFQTTKFENTDIYKNENAADKAKIKQLQDELASRKEQEKLYSEKVEMTTWQKELLADCFGNFPDCVVKYDPHENVAILEGKSESVKDHHLKLLKETKKLKEELQTISPAMVCILSKEKGKEYLQKLNSQQIKGAKAFLQDKYLSVLAKDDESLQSAVEFFKNRIHNETFKLDAKITSEKQHLEQLMLEDKFLVKISWPDNDPTIHIEGIKDDVFLAVSHLSKLQDEHGFHDKSFNVTGSHARFFHKILESEIKQHLRSVELVDIVSTEAQVSIKFKGDRQTANQVLRKLTELKTKVTTKTWDLSAEFKKPEDLMLITKASGHEKFKKKIDNFEIHNKCTIITKLPKLKCTVGASKKKQRTHSAPAPKERRQFKVAAPTYDDTKLSFALTNTCQLVVKPYGDITKQPSDVLVCLLDKRADLRRTRVGQTFNKICPNLWKILQTEHEAHPQDPVLTTNGPLDPLKCQAICHIILAPWDPNTSPQLLTKSIQLVITQAVALGAKSVSFPVLGCGKAFGFPPSDVAQITLSSVKASSVGNTIQKIVLLAPDKELYKEFKTEAPKLFQPSPVAVQGAAAMASPDQTDNLDDGSDSSEESEDDELYLKIEGQDSDNAEISILALHGTKIETLWSNLKKEIQKICLHTGYFNQEISNFWPKKSRDTILQEAKKKGVWVEISPNPKTKKPGYLVKGAKKNVEEVISIIRQEFEEFSSGMPKQRMTSDKAPPRGTPEFIRYAANSDEIFPSYWKLNSSKTYHKSLWGKFKDKIGIGKSEDCKFLVDVDARTKDAIKSLIAKTWDPTVVGHGNDAQGLAHRSIKVMDVKRIENVHLFELYSVHRKSLFSKKCANMSLCTDVGKLRGSKGRIATTELLDKFMKEELYYEINEHYLFHGTRNSSAICSNGMDPRVSSEGGMFGKGTYLAEKFTKSDQYADSRSNRSQPGQTLTMILARVLLGNVFVCNDQHKSVQSKQSVKLTRPPCMNCLQDICGCANQTLFDSVMGDGKWIFREFVVYEKAPCYPEYLIYYQRL